MCQRSARTNREVGRVCLVFTNAGNDHKPMCMCMCMCRRMCMFMRASVYMCICVCTCVCVHVCVSPFLSIHRVHRYVVFCLAVLCASDAKDVTFCQLPDTEAMIQRTFELESACHPVGACTATISRRHVITIRTLLTIMSPLSHYRITDGLSACTHTPNAGR